MWHPHVIKASNNRAQYVDYSDKSVSDEQQDSAIKEPLQIRWIRCFINWLADFIIKSVAFSQSFSRVLKLDIFIYIRNLHISEEGIYFPNETLFFRV
jgi:hypothetical protein